MKTKLIKSIAVIFAFLLADNVFVLLKTIHSDWSQVLPDHWFLYSLCIMGIKLIIPVIVVILLEKNVFASLGLHKDKVIKSIVWGVVMTLPMTLGMALLYPLNELIEINRIWVGSVQAGVMEEVLFRGFLFGLLFRYCGWGFIPSALVGAVFFGMGHVYQGHDLGSALLAFAVTAVGAVWFAWLYAEWRFSLWMPITLHILMNMSWQLYSISGGAAGSGMANVFRLITIASSVFLTIYLLSRKQGYIVNRSNLIWQREDQ